jgi:hypothetical protein
MHALDEGQKVAHEVVADRRSGKSSGDNLKRFELPVTLRVVIAFDRDAEGDLKPGEARKVPECGRGPTPGSRARA